MASCYRMVGTSSGTQIGTNPIDVPCPGPAGKDGHSQCCVTGDTCLSNGICHFTHASTGGSGYYTSACTDRTLNSSACAQACRKFGLPDVVYDSNSNLWACCGLDAASEVSCQNPSNETFMAPAPQILLAQKGITEPSSLATSTISSTISTNRVTATSARSTSSTSVTVGRPAGSPTTSPIPIISTNSSSSSLNAGAIAGISVGCALAGALLALLAWTISRRRKNINRFEDLSELDNQHEVLELADQKKPSELGGKHRFVELADSQRTEVPTGKEVWELGDGRR